MIRYYKEFIFGGDEADDSLKRYFSRIKYLAPHNNV
tara:strand:- start:1782 stop:1889 length:108 start_codon:yes stop_codon:yes gene_type:complete